MIGRTNVGGGTGDTLTVTTPGAGITVTVGKDGKIKTKISDADGVAVFRGLESGEWTVTMTDGSQTATKTATVTTEYAVELTFFAATIHVTYPAGSTCTATDGVTTLTAPDTSGTWACVVPNAGTWTVTVADKGWSESTVISAEGQSVDVDLSKRYLYKNGNQYESFTGGLNGYSIGSSSSGSTRVSPTVAYGKNTITVTVDLGSHAFTVGSLFVKNTIDLTMCSILSINATSRSGNSGTIAIGVTKTRADKYESAAIIEINRTGAVSLDISDLTGEYYIFITLSGASNKSISFDLMALE